MKYKRFKGESWLSGSNMSENANENAISTSSISPLLAACHFLDRSSCNISNFIAMCIILSWMCLFASNIFR